MEHQVDELDPSRTDEPLDELDTLEAPDGLETQGADELSDGVDVRTRPVALDEDSLRRKLATQPTIEQAKGMLMGYYGLDAERAFALLRRWSARSHVKLRDLCQHLVAAAAVGDPQPYGALRRALEELQGQDER